MLVLTLVIIIGGLLTALGWCAHYIEKLPHLWHFLVPKYARLARFQRRILNGGADIKPSDKAFHDILAVLPEECSSKAKKPTAIHAERASFVVVGGPHGYSQGVSVTIVCEGGEEVKYTWNHMESDIREAYLERRVFRIASIAFWLGLSITISTGLYSIISN